MKAALAAAAGLLLWVAAPACAHRLDEFLQATTIAVARDQVTVQIRLTPGVAVVSSVLTEIDRNGDGDISKAEQHAYAEHVLRALTLSLDGKRLPLRLVAWIFPSVEDIKDGLGEILLKGEADVPPGGQDRRLIFENHYQSAMAVYLVNCLMPNDPGIRVLAQNRNFEQSFYQLDYTQAGLSPAGPGSQSLSAAYFYPGLDHIRRGYEPWLFTGALGLAVTALWLIFRQHGRSPKR